MEALRTVMEDVLLRNLSRYLGVLLPIFQWEMLPKRPLIMPIERMVITGHDSGLV